MKKYLGAVFFITVFFLEIGPSGRFAGSFLISALPAVTFFLLSRSIPAGASASLLYAFFLDVANLTRVPVNTFFTIIVLIIYLLLKKRGMDFRFNKNNLVLAICFAILRLCGILLFYKTSVSVSFLALAIVLNVAVTITFFYLSIFLYRKIDG